MGGAAEVHHAVPRCLLRLHDVTAEVRFAGEPVGARIEFELEAERWGVDVEIPRPDLQALIEASGVEVERQVHRRIHENDWQRWGRRGGLETFRRYGSAWYAALALRRWGRLSARALEAARPVVRP